MRENFAELLRETMAYVDEGKLVLNKRNMEKFQQYFRFEKLKDLAGVTGIAQRL